MIEDMDSRLLTSVLQAIAGNLSLRLNESALLARGELSDILGASASRAGETLRLPPALPLKLIKYKDLINCQTVKHHSCVLDTVFQVSTV